MTEGDRVAAPLNAWIENARRAGAAIVASRDWHPMSHPSFKAEGGPWPAHCLQDSEGAQFHRDLNIPSDALIAHGLSARPWIPGSALRAAPE